MPSPSCGDEADWIAVCWLFLPALFEGAFKLRNFLLSFVESSTTLTVLQVSLVYFMKTKIQLQGWD